MSVKLKSIAEEWEGYAASVLPKDCSEVQRKETRLAFYAGAWTLVAHMHRLGENDISEDAGTQHIEALKNECLEFQKEYIKRYSEGN